MKLSRQKLAANLAAVRERIGQACRRVRRYPEEITLVAVTKSVELPVIHDLIGLGHEDFGESRVQQLSERTEQIGDWLTQRPGQPPRVRWHMVGHLQRNKIKPCLAAAEVVHAKEEGVQFKTLTNPIRIIGDENNRVVALECLRMELGEPDDSGRRRPVPIEGSEFELPCDMAIPALGSQSNPLLTSNTEGLELNRWGNIVADDETCATSLPGVYAGGDIVIGAATVIEAMGAGKQAARAIDEYIQEKSA